MSGNPERTELPTAVYASVRRSSSARSAFGLALVTCTRIVADVTRDGNFMPLLLDPIDFGAMYMQQAQQASQLAENEPAGEA